MAQAHSPIEGIGDFYGGMLHPLWVPSHLISILALGLLAGQQGLACMRITMACFSLALLAGLVASGAVSEASLQTLLLALASGLSVLLAISCRLPGWLLWLPSLLLGGLLGLDSAAETPAVPNGFLAQVGTWLGACLLLLCLMTLADSLVKPWQRIAIRIAGAWIGASAMLVLSLTLASATA